MNAGGARKAAGSGAPARAGTLLAHFDAGFAPPVSARSAPERAWDGERLAGVQYVDGESGSRDGARRDDGCKSSTGRMVPR
jgi:hypothetical protein